MYVFNYAEGGYAVIPTLDVKGDIIAYIEDGEFNIQDTLTNDLSRFLVSMMIDYQKNVIATHNALKTKGMLRPDPRKDMLGAKCHDVTLSGGMNYQFGEPTVTLDEVVRNGDEYYKTKGCYLPMRYTDYEEKYLGPLLTTTWNQDVPYNIQTPRIGTKNAFTGCVAMAVAQIMVYHGNPVKYPSSILGFDVPSQFHFYIDKNTNIAGMKRTKVLTESSSTGAKDNISRFIAIIGHMLKNDWGVDATGAKDKEVPKVFNNMGYASAGVSDYNGLATQASLNGLKPVYITGWRTLTKGHSWVVDGYKIEDATEEYYYYYFGANGAYHGRLRQDNIGRSYSHIYFHHNFGWGGTCNGYYVDGVFDTSQVYESTGGTSTDVRVYKKIEIIPNITKI